MPKRKARKAPRRKKRLVSEMFYIPEGVEELTHQSSEVGGEADDDDFGDFASLEDDMSLADDVDYIGAPDTPTIYGIITPQEFRMNESGWEVVDVIFDVEPVAGATDYEFRVTKV